MPYVLETVNTINHLFFRDYLNSTALTYFYFKYKLVFVKSINSVFMMYTVVDFIVIKQNKNNLMRE